MVNRLQPWVQDNTESGFRITKMLILVNTADKIPYWKNVFELSSDYSSCVFGFWVLEYFFQQEGCILNKNFSWFIRLITHLSLVNLNHKAVAQNAPMKTHLKPEILLSSQPLLLKEMLLAWWSKLVIIQSWVGSLTWLVVLDLEKLPLLLKLSILSTLSLVLLSHLECRFSLLHWSWNTDQLRLLSSWLGSLWLTSLKVYWLLWR